MTSISSIVIHFRNSYMRQITISDCDYLLYQQYGNLNTIIPSIKVELVKLHKCTNKTSITPQYIHTIIGKVRIRANTLLREAKNCKYHENHIIAIKFVLNEARSWTIFSCQRNFLNKKIWQLSVGLLWLISFLVSFN